MSAAKAKKKDEKRWVLTPKGIAKLTLQDLGIIEPGDSRFETFWELFECRMRKFGYVRDDAPPKKANGGAK